MCLLFFMRKTEIFGLNEMHHDLYFFLSTLYIIFSSQSEISFLPRYKKAVRNETGIFKYLDLNFVAFLAL